MISDKSRDKLGDLPTTRHFSYLTLVASSSSRRAIMHTLLFSYAHAIVFLYYYSNVLCSFECSDWLKMVNLLFSFVRLKYANEV